MMLRIEKVTPFFIALQAADHALMAARHVLTSTLDGRLAEHAYAVPNVNDLISQLDNMSCDICDLRIDRYDKVCDDAQAPRQRPHRYASPRILFRRNPRNKRLSAKRERLSHNIILRRPARPSGWVGDGESFIESQVDNGTTCYRTRSAA